MPSTIESGATLECTYFLDILSQWCYIADRALRDLRLKYPTLRVSLRFVPIAFKDALPVTRTEQARVYKRSAMITGIATVPWIQENETTRTWEANATALAAAQFGLEIDRVRESITRAALLSGEPMGREGAAIALVSSEFGVSEDKLRQAVYGPEVATEMQAFEDEFKALRLSVRPTFVIRNAIEDHVILGGAYRFDLLDACVQSLATDAAGYERFEQEASR